MVRHACLTSLLLLGACTSFYPSLYTPPTGTPSVAAILDSAKALQDEYASGYKESAKVLDLSALPLIGAAAAAASILAFGDNGDDALAAIGIGTAAYTAGRATALPASMPDIYAKGHDALGCVRVEGALFAGTDADANLAAYQGKLASLATAISVAETAVASEKLPAGAGEAERTRFTATLTSLAAAIATAKSLRDAGNRELADYRSAPSVFGAAVGSIATRVATRGREGRAVDFATLRGQFTSSIAAAGAAAPPPPIPTGIDKAGKPLAAPTPLEKLSDALNDLVNANQTVVAGNPGYSAALTRVAACPTRAG